MNTIPRTKDRIALGGGVGLYPNNHMRQGSDPVCQSKGSKVYNRTVWLMEQIDREQRLRAGAEKLLSAASNKKIQVEIANELKIVNTNLQALWEEMADIISNHHSTPEIHQPKSATSVGLLHPMIPLSMKETSFVDFLAELKNVITSHYHENAEEYKFDLNCLTDMRKACCQPLCGEDGLEILFTYYNQLYFVDRRFFPSSSNGPVSFKWYDSFTGLPYVQKTVGFEKGGILFNIGVMYSKIASKMEVKEPEGLNKAVENFQSAAGAFQFLHDNFLYAPSVDMQLASTEFLVQLMLTQAFECRLELRLEHDTGVDALAHLEFAQEASAVASMYIKALSMASNSVVSGQIPVLWVQLMTCKMHYHRAFAHYHLATSLNLATAADTSFCTGALLMRPPDDRKLDSSVHFNQLIEDEEGRKTMMKAHLRQSILAFEESMRIVDKHRKFAKFHQKLKTCHDQSLSKFSVLEEEDDFTELFTPPEILPKVRDQLQPILPDFSKYKVEDLFHRLGCIAIFSARHMWTVPRQVTLSKKNGEEFGFSIRGDSPVIVATIDEGSLAQRSGLLVGDFIIAVGGVDIKWTKHDRVVSMIKLCSDTVALHLVTPIDHNYIDPSQPPQCTSPQTTSECLKQEMEFAEERKEKPKSRPNSASWKLRPFNSRSKELGSDNCGFSPFSGR